MNQLKVAPSPKFISGYVFTTCHVPPEISISSVPCVLLLSITATIFRPDDAGILSKAGSEYSSQYLSRSLSPFTNNAYVHGVGVASAPLACHATHIPGISTRTTTKTPRPGAAYLLYNVFSSHRASSRPSSQRRDTQWQGMVLCIFQAWSVLFGCSPT